MNFNQNITNPIKMKNKYHIIQSLSFLFLLLTLFSGCLKDDCEATRTFIRFEPVFVTTDELRADLQVLAPRELQEPGKIYFYQDYIFINEIREGIHIIDNRDPKNPIPLAFVKIRGNVDMAVKGNKLYADNVVDLITLDISDPSAPVLVDREESVFSEYAHFNDQRDAFLAYYKETEVTQEMPCSFSGGDWIFSGEAILIDQAVRPTSSFSADLSRASSSGGQSTSGIGGSMARFTISGDYLYTVNSWQIKVFDIKNLVQPSLANTVDVGWGIETIFPYKDNLFLGSNSGMFIFDKSDPVAPVLLSVFAHAQACDPVFVSGDLAYVTLRGGTPCQNFNNQLDVVDISNLSNPKLLRTYPMDNPHGLSLSDNNLYICEGDFGLKVFDASDWEKIDKNRLTHLKGFATFDIITLSDKKLAMVIGKDGFYQFDITNPSALKELSVLPVAK